RVWRGHGAGSWRCAFPVPHLAESLAMVYAFAAVRSAARGAGAGMPGMAAAAGAARFPVLAVVFTLFMVCYVAWLGDRLTSISPAAAVTTAPGGAGPTVRTFARPEPVRQAGGCWPVLAPRA